MFLETINTSRWHNRKIVMINTNLLLCVEVPPCLIEQICSRERYSGTTILFHALISIFFPNPDFWCMKNRSSLQNLKFRIIMFWFFFEPSGCRSLIHSQLLMLLFYEDNTFSEFKQIYLFRSYFKIWY